MRCDLVIPLYQDIVRAYDQNECIVARKVYLVSYGGHLYGTFDFTTMAEFVDYRNRNCIKKPLCCDLVYNDCYVTFNGKIITIKQTV